MTSFNLCAYWNARKETIDACANRLARFLSKLSDCADILARWYEKGGSRRQARQREIEFKNADCLVDLLERGRNRKDIGQEIMHDLGFHVGMWNGRKTADMVSLSVKCGVYSIVAGLGGNSVVMDLPEELGELVQTERMEKVLLAAATSWEPDWAGVFSSDAIRMRTFEPSVPFVDWMIYVSNKLAPNPIVPEPSLVKPIDTIGHLIVVQEEPVKTDNPIHFDRVKRVESALRINSSGGRV